MAHASVAEARRTPARRSRRTAMRRNRASQAGQGPLHLPAVAAELLAVPRRAARGMMPPARPARRHRRWSRPLSAWSLPGRRRGRPRRPRVGGTASSAGAGRRRSGRSAGRVVGPSGVPPPSTTRWRLVPALPRSVGSGPAAAPPLGAHRRAVARGPRPVEPVGRARAPPRRPVRRGPGPRFGPPDRPPPAGLAAAAPRGGHAAPAEAGPRHEDDPGARRTARHARSAALRPRRIGWRQRRDRRPGVVGDERCGHRSPTPKPGSCPRF